MSWAHHNTDRDHFLYRIYDAEGVLLYIGCSLRPADRLKTHGERHWNSDLPYALELFQRMDHYEISEPYPTMREGLAAEAAAIRAEQPMFNICHNRSRAVA